MRYTVTLTDEVKEKLRALPLDQRREIDYRPSLLENDLAGDVKKLQGSEHEYRLRVGRHRILLELEGSTANVYGVGPRKDIYQ